MIKCGFFDAKMNNGQPDRIYSSDDINDFFDGIFTDGIFERCGSAFATTASEGLQVAVDTGKAMVHRHWISNDSVEYLPITKAHPTLPRITLVILRYDRINRNIGLCSIDGTAASNPQPPSLTHTEDIYEMQIASITVRAGATSISNDDIVDKRTYVDSLPAAAKVNYRRYYLLLTANTKEILIPEKYKYTSNTNMQVFVNGILLTEDEYSIALASTTSGYKIVLKNTVFANNEIILVMIS